LIRLRLCDMDDYSSYTGHKRIAKWYEREMGFFEILNGNYWEKEKFPPFRDAESAGMIRSVAEAEFVEGDWYSMVGPYGRTCLAALGSGMKYGLTVIANSRKGFYTDITGDAGAGENVWQYLAGLEMDILLAYPYKEFLKDGVLPLYLPRPFTVENYRYQGEVLEAVVTSEKPGSLPEYRNGKLHVTPWMFEPAYSPDNYNIIPSKDVREYLAEINYVFTDLEHAALLYHTIEDKEEVWEKLEELKGSIKDTELQRRIEERICYEKNCKNEFMKNESRHYIYTVSYEEEEIEWVMGHFLDAELAISCGKKNCREKKLPFEVNKYRIIHENVTIYDAYEETMCGRLRYNAEGKLISADFWEQQEEEKETGQVIGCFEDIFLSVPSPFRRGDVVSLIGSNRVGVVETDSREREEFVRKAQAKGVAFDWFDAALTVCFLTEDGRFSHDHINPIWLEYATKQQQEGNEEVLKMASLLLKGEADLDSFLVLYHHNLDEKKAARINRQPRPFVIPQEESEKEGGKK